MPPWIPSQTRMRCKLGIQRIRQTIDKNESLAKRSRRDVAGLLEQGKIETASVRTEALILSDAHNELLELLELYLELILARFGLLDVPGGSSASSKEPDEGVREAVCAIVYAAPRSEIRELHIIREAFMSRYGRDWAVSVMENTHAHVPSRIVNKCKMTTPDKGYVEAYLVEISKAYNLAWRPEGWVEVSEQLLEEEEEGTAEMKQRVLEAELSNASAGDELRKASQTGDGDDDDKNEGGNLALPSTPSSAPKLKNVKSSTSSIPIIHPDSSSKGPSQPNDPSAEDEGENDILPAIPPTDPAQSERTVIIKTMSPQSKPSVSLPPKPAPSASTAQNGGSTAADDKRYDDLAKRFEALKRK